MSLKPDNNDLKQISDADMNKVEALKKAISDGNYIVPAEDLAPKLMESLYRNTILDEAPNGASDFQLEKDDQVVQKGEDDARVNQNGLHSAPLPSNVAATKRKPR
jgi:hypothetical protein